MSLVRSQIAITVRSADPPRDICVNDVYHEIASGVLWNDIDYQNHATEIMTLFSGQNTGSGSSFVIYSNRGINVKVYDMADAKPRPIKGQAQHVPTGWETQNLGPRDLASCLSFYGNNRGIATQRGRIFIGPFNQADVAPVVGPSMRSIITDLGHGLFDIGGENVKHVVHSVKLNAQTTVQNYWCNDVWDHMSSRRQKEQARTYVTP